MNKYGSIYIESQLKEPVYDVKSTPHKEFQTYLRSSVFQFQTGSGRIPESVKGAGLQCEIHTT